MPQALEDFITILELIGLVLLSILPVVLIFGITIWLLSRRDKKKAENADTEINKDSSTEDGPTAFFKTVVPYRYYLTVNGEDYYSNWTGGEMGDVYTIYD